MFDSIFGFLANNVLSLTGGIWSVLAFAVAYLAKKYLMPLVEVERNRRYANWIAAIADELTDDLKARYPDKRWVEELDKAVDKIMEICGINEEVAQRAIRAAATRK